MVNISLNELLVDAINGTSPSYAAMQIPTVAKYGQYTGGFRDDWTWDISKLKKLPVHTLVKIYKYVKTR